MHAEFQALPEGPLQQHAAVPDLPCPWGDEISGAACAIECSDGELLAARLLWLDGNRREIAFRRHPEALPTLIDMEQLRLLTLTTLLPLRPAEAEWYCPPEADRPVQQVYALSFPGGGQRRGLSLGHAERTYGHFLVRPSGRGGAVVRVFVPRNAHTEFSLLDDRRQGGRHQPVQANAGPPGAGPAQDPHQLRLALQAQSCTPLRLMGEVLVEMGLATAGQLAEVLDGQAEDPGVPVGDRLVAAGHLSAADLRAAQRRKQAYPQVDLRRFPLDLVLLKRLPLALAEQWQVLPVMRTDQGVVVAMADPDDPRVREELGFLFQAPVLPVQAGDEQMGLLVAAAYARHRLDGR